MVSLQNLLTQTAGVAPSQLQPQAAGAAAGAAATGSDASTKNVTASSFLTLLVAEMKNQDPTQPQDPTQYVSQLAQVNSLEQLISINQELGGINSAASTTPTQG